MIKTRHYGHDGSRLRMLRDPLVESLFGIAGYFGHGPLGVIVGLVLLIHGYTSDNRRTRNAGIATLAALVIAGTAAQVLKITFQWPRPKYLTSYGFPSGHTSAVFALASVLGYAFPMFSPLIYLLATATAISRLYFRAHYSWDVFGGMVIGLLIGHPLARKLVPKTAAAKLSARRLALWLAIVAPATIGLAFFVAAESNIRRHLLEGVDTTTPSPWIGSYDFGSPQARNLLRAGWSGDESWDNGTRSVVWANSRVSEVIINLPDAQDYRIRFLAFPYAPAGPACQGVEIKLNRNPITKVFLEQGWHWYEFGVPRRFVKTGANNLQLLYDYAESPQFRQGTPDTRTLSVAFDMLDIYSGRQPATVGAEISETSQ